MKAFAFWDDPREDIYSTMKTTTPTQPRRTHTTTVTLGDLDYECRAKLTIEQSDTQSYTIDDLSAECDRQPVTAVALMRALEAKLKVELDELAAANLL